MSQLVDNLIAMRILYMLVTPFEETESFKRGIIDKDGNPLKKLKDMTWTEKDHYSMLHRMIFRIKKIMNKVPVVNTKLGTLATAYFLVKECYSANRLPANLEKQYIDLLRKVQKENIVLAEEQILVEKFINEELPANVTGEKVSTDTPVVRKRKRDLKLLNRATKRV